MAEFIPIRLALRLIPLMVQKDLCRKTVGEFILSQKHFGNAWDNKPVQFGYDANVDGEVKKYVATFNFTTFTFSITLSANGYTANQLYKNTVIDEDGNKTIGFKNGLGRVILARKVLNGTENVDTYYVYNNYGLLAYVLSPKTIHEIKNLAMGASIPDTVLNTLCYQYNYDGQNRLVEKKLPGKGWEYMVYDYADRVIMTSDTNLAAKNKWMITKYDPFGRVAYTGIIAGGDRLSTQNQARAYVITESRNQTGFTRNGMQMY